MYRIKTYHPPGTAPGTLVPSVLPAEQALAIRLIDYTADQFVEHTLISADDCKVYLSRDSITWIQVNGHPDPDTLRALGAQFELRDLALEDVINTGQRSKLDLEGDQLFLILNMPTLDGDREPDIVQISLFAGRGYVICFCPLAEDPFEPIRKRLRAASNQRIRSRGADYLLYALIDLIVDAAFPLLESLGERIDELEDGLLQMQGRETLAEIHRMRRTLLHLRRALWPQREVVGLLMRGEVEMIEEGTRPYLHDCYDHSIQVIDLLESFREMSASLLEVYLSSISNRTNEIMRVLTIIATIFIPLTFIVGIYGMNFAHPDSPWAMPELYWYYGYPLVWAVMLSVVGCMLWFFRRRGWL
jgi:magnesium transporter